ncbi:unnamed protein product [Acanthoscelides obtectus]|uniref:SCAN domain-containing protein 3 n=1 Tax=Acanthoscelides obtectus TaxID=200917 RepID=A0A9P0LDP8_ACAOB|nr:unnamed protein product [Acanthoscelides obtectus]CAK1670804.1 SCAN domain-containing protein 3 [Acanthoscelides obtectus]
MERLECIKQEITHIFVHKRPTLDRMFASTSQRSDDGLRASYNISLLIAKSGKPQTIGEKLILPAVEEILKTVLHKPASDIIKRIPLSNNTVERHIDEMSSDIESFLLATDGAPAMVGQFLDTKDNILKENSMKRKTDTAYLTDLFTKFNMVNLQLQGDSLNLLKTKSILSAFLARVKLMKQNIGRGEFSQFPNLSQTSCQEDDVSTCVQHLNALYSDFESRFEDILTMVIPPWIINPYGDIEETNVIIQEELTELSTNEELKVQFENGYQQFWLQNNIPVTYPILWYIARTFLISFPSSYLVETGFSAVTNLLMKKRNRLDIISRGDLRLTLTKLTPNVDNLLLKHQVHLSH